MKSADDIKKFFKNAVINTNSKIDQRFLNKLLNIFEQTKTSKPEDEPMVWSVIVRSRITKIIAAAVLILTIWLGVIMFGSSGEEPETETVKQEHMPPKETIVETQKETKIPERGILKIAVTDKSDGRPIEGADIGLWSLKGDNDIRRNTNREGMASIHLVPGEYKFGVVYKEGYKQLLSEEKVIITEGSIQQLSIELTELPKVSGIVRDGNGEPVAGAEVRILPYPTTVQTDTEGKFKAYYYSYSADIQQFWIFTRHAERNLAILRELSDQEQEIELILKPGVTVFGKVVDPNAEAIAGAIVHTNILLADNFVSLGPEVQTDINGQYEISGLAIPSSYEITIMSEGYDSKTKEFEITKDSGIRLEMKAVKLGVVNVLGKVTDNNSYGVVEATIEVYDVFTEKNKWTSFPLEVKLSGKTTTSSDGSFSLERRTPSRETEYCFAIIHKDDYSLGWLAYGSWEEQIGTIKVDENPAILVGQVVDSSGVAITGATVYAIVSYQKDITWDMHEEPSFEVASTKCIRLD